MFGTLNDSWTLNMAYNLKFWLSMIDAQVWAKQFQNIYSKFFSRWRDLKKLEQHFKSWLVNNKFRNSLRVIVDIMEVGIETSFQIFLDQRYING